MIKTIYYYYFLFYNRILAESNPHLATVLVLSFFESLIANLIFTIIGVRVYCFNASKWQGIALCASLVIINSFYYLRNNRGEDIVEQKPKVFDSNTLSIAVTVLVSFIALYTLFNISDWKLALLREC